MNKISLIKLTVFGWTGFIGAIGAFISSLYGGWNGAMTTLLIFMGIDILTGIVCAGVFNKSNKTEGGALESRAGFKGLCRKGVVLLIVLVAARLDLILNTNYIKDMVVIAFITNETISIIENAGLMGIPMPQTLIKAIELLKSKSEGGENKI